MSTYREILDMAYARSLLNQASEISTESTELLQVTHRAVTGLFAVGARVNPMYFGKISSAVSYSMGWDRPIDAESVFRIEKDDGTEVTVVPLNDQGAEDQSPCVYEMGQVYYLAGGTGLATTDDLVFYYAKSPFVPNALTDNVDAMFPDEYDELLALEVAVYLCVKDGGRDQEFQVLKAERDMWARRFVAHLEHATTALKVRFANRGLANSQAIVPIGSLFGAGADLT